MITNAEQYQKAQEELQLLEDRLHRLQQSYPRVNRCRILTAETLRT